MPRKGSHCGLEQGRRWRLPIRCFTHPSRQHPLHSLPIPPDNPAEIAYDVLSLFENRLPRMSEPPDNHRECAFAAVVSTVANLLRGEPIRPVNIVVE